MLCSKLARAVAVAVMLSLAFVVPDADADNRLVTRQISVSGYRMQLVASVERFRGGSAHRLSVVLAQRSGASIQRHEWQAEEKPFRLSASRDLRGGHIRARFRNGGYINMRFEASGAASRRRMPLCGRNRRSEGSLTGTLRLPTRSRRFGTVVRRHFHAWLARERSIGCQTPWNPKTEDIYVFDPEVTLSMSAHPLTIVNNGNQTVQLYERSNPGSSHIIVARSQPRQFSFTDDFSSAAAKAIGPYFDGALSFSATKSGAGGSAGTVHGDFRVKLAVPGPFTVPPASAFLGTISP